jgi:hypothetical protein
MFDAVVTALLRSVLHEARVDGPTHEAGKKSLIASKALETAQNGELEGDNLRPAGRQALLPAPSMWN